MEASLHILLGAAVQLSIFGGTGATGRLLVERALEAGHAVTVHARSPGKLTLTILA